MARARMSALMLATFPFMWTRIGRGGALGLLARCYPVVVYYGQLSGAITGAGLAVSLARPVNAFIARYMMLSAGCGRMEQERHSHAVATHYRPGQPQAVNHRSALFAG